MEKSIDTIIERFKKEKLKNTIKVDILNNLNYLKKFIVSSPGVISPGVVSDKIKELEGIFHVWIRNDGLVSDCKSLFRDIESRYIDITESELNKDRSSDLIESHQIVLTNKPIKEGIIPWFTKKLYSGVSIKKYDVAYLPVGPCNHYCIVYKVVGDKTYVVPLTTDVDSFDGYIIEKSRFFRGKAIYSIYQFPTEIVQEKFVLPYDHRGEVIGIFKYLEEFMYSIFPKKKSKSKTIKSL